MDLTRDCNDSEQVVCIGCALDFGGLSIVTDPTIRVFRQFHEADDDTVIWLESTVTAALTE